MLSYLRKFSFSTIKVVPIFHPEQDVTFSYLAYGQNKHNCFLIDPGLSNRTIEFLQQNPDLRVSHLLLSHNHLIHTGNLPEILQTLGSMYNNSKIEVVIGWHDALTVPEATIQVLNKTTIEAEDFSVTCLPAPSHTVGSLMFHFEQVDALHKINDLSYQGKSFVECYKCVFTGDTHFVGGCGKFLIHNAKNVHGSLKKIMRLPKDTFLFPGHEYTVNNLKWAMGIEWENEAYARKLEWAEEKRRNGEFTIPSTVEEEFEINIFWRTKVALVQKKFGIKDPIEILGRLRMMKDEKKSFKES